MNDLLAHLVRASLSGGVFVAGVWLFCRAVPRLPPALRCGLWWAASLKLLVALVWIAPLELALLPAPEAAIESPGPALAATSTALPSGGTALAPGPAPGALPAPPTVPWRALPVLVWIVGLGFGGARLARDLGMVRQLRSTSRPVDDPVLLARFDHVRERLGIARPVELRLADAIRSPLTLGLARPAVLLPAAGLDRLRGEELEMALCHELLHVRRRDLWTGWIPQLARRVFFFHPLAALAAREHALAREAACDTAVLSVLGAPARSYGRLLLRWTGRPGTSDPLPEIAAAAGASSSFTHLKRRLEMLQSSCPTTRTMKLLGGALAVAALVALTPLRIVAQPPAPPAPAEAPEAPAPPPPPETAPVIASLPAPPTPPAPPAAPPKPARIAGVPPAPPAPAVLAAIPAPPAPPAPPEHAGGGSYFWSDDDGDEGWALMGPDGHAWIQNAHIGNGRLEALRKGGEPMVWLRHDGREYVIRDRATIERLQGILQPQIELGRMQGELGGRQGELGEKQGALGARQGELGSRQGALGARQAELAAEQVAVAHGAGDDAAREERRRRREALGEQMRELGEQQRALGAQQRELAEKQRPLAARQRELGEKQRELGERQREAAERARPQVRALFDRAIADGTAEAI